jgi:hypothetical protein
MKDRNLRVLPDFISIPEDELFLLRIRINTGRNRGAIIGKVWR